jgi:hypothetical protein
MPYQHDHHPQTSCNTTKALKPDLNAPCGAAVVVAATPSCRTLREPGLRHELHCISISHYCMRAKWALQLAGLPFKSVHYLPLAHMLGIKRLQARSSSSSSTD